MPDLSHLFELKSVLTVGFLSFVFLYYFSRPLSDWLLKKFNAYEEEKNKDIDQLINEKKILLQRTITPVKSDQDKSSSVHIQDRDLDELISQIESQLGWDEISCEQLIIKKIKQFEIPMITQTGLIPAYRYTKDKLMGKMSLLDNQFNFFSFLIFKAFLLQKDDCSKIETWPLYLGTKLFDPKIFFSFYKGELKGFQLFFKSLKEREMIQLEKKWADRLKVQRSKVWLEYLDLIPGLKKLVLDENKILREIEQQDGLSQSKLLRLMAKKYHPDTFPWELISKDRKDIWEKKLHEQFTKIQELIKGRDQSA